MELLAYLNAGERPFRCRKTVREDAKSYLEIMMARVGAELFVSETPGS